MMLRALGYEDLSKGASQWDQPVAAKANEISLFAGLSGASNTLSHNDRHLVAGDGVVRPEVPVVADNHADGAEDLNSTTSLPKSPVEPLCRKGLRGLEYFRMSTKCLPVSLFDRFRSLGLGVVLSGHIGEARGAGADDHHANQHNGGQSQAESPYVGSCPFTDVPTWAQKYVTACYDNKIVGGRTESGYDGSGDLAGDGDNALNNDVLLHVRGDHGGLEGVQAQLSHLVAVQGSGGAGAHALKNADFSALADGGGLPHRAVSFQFNDFNEAARVPV